MKNYFVLCIGLWLAACGSGGEKAAENTGTIASAEEIDGMSIYQLTSTWETQDGQNLQLQDLEGEVLAVVMIYTSCKIACPRLVADMKNLEKKVGSTPKPVRYVLVSIDPETDNPERLKSFASENGMEGDQWLFLRSSQDNTREFANVMAVKYARISPIDFSHSNIISIFDTQGTMIHQMEGLSVDNEKTVEVILTAAK